MRASLFHALLILAVLVLTSGGRAHAGDSNPGGIRIMPLGDSITQGNTAYNSWRRPLWLSLVAAGYHVDFVGSQTTNFTGPAPAADFDHHNDGHWGWKLTDVLPQVDGWLATAQPQIVLIHLGTNDTNPAAQMLADLEAIIAKARAANPDVTIITAQLMTNWGQCAIYNADMPAMAARLTTARSPIIVVNQYQGFINDPAAPGTHTQDWVHPNVLGEDKMAAVWFAALQSVLPPPGGGTSGTSGTGTTSTTGGTTGAVTLSQGGSSKSGCGVGSGLLGCCIALALGRGRRRAGV